MTVENVLPPNTAYLILSIPGTRDPIHKTYVNCRAVWVGDTLTVNSGSLHVASYHRSLVLLAENRGPVPPVPPVNMPSSTQPSQNGTQGPGQNPNDTPTQLMPAVPSQAPAQVPTASMQMRPVPAPNLGNGTSANFPQQTSPTNTSSSDDAEEGELDQTFQRSIAALKPQRSDRLDFLQTWNLQISENRSMDAFPSADLVPSGWQAAKQLVLSRNDDRVISRERIRQSGNALARKAGRVAPTHRKRYMDKTKTFFEKFLSLTTHGAQVAARISTMVLFTGWASEEVNA